MSDQITSAGFVLSLCFSVLAIYLIVKCWRAVWVDQTRSELFSLRDELFLYAVDHNLLGTDANTMLRDYNNALLRYTHRVSFMHIFAIVALDRALEQPSESESYKTLVKSIDALPRQHREYFTEHHAKLNITMTNHLFRSSLILRASFILALPFMLLSGKKKEQRRLNTRTTLVLEREAYQAMAA